MPDEDTLGPCGCTDYHLADCPLVTGRDYPPDADYDGPMWPGEEE